MYDLHRPASDPMVDLAVHRWQMDAGRPLAIGIAFVLVPRKDGLLQEDGDVPAEDPALILPVADPVNVEVSIVLVSELLVRISISIMCVCSISLLMIDVAIRFCCSVPMLLANQHHRTRTTQSKSQPQPVSTSIRFQHRK